MGPKILVKSHKPVLEDAQFLVPDLTPDGKEGGGDTSGPQDGKDSTQRWNMPCRGFPKIVSYRRKQNNS